jgi:hypothetical protein
MTSQALLTEAEALRAIYLDFEGNQDRPPTLLGVLWNDDVTSPLLRVSSGVHARKIVGS